MHFDSLPDNWLNTNMEISDFFSDEQNNMLSALKPVMEQRIYTKDAMGNEKEVNVFRNVSAQSLVQLVMTSRMKQVRGLVEGRDIYFWDSYYANHDEVAKALGVEYRLENRIHVWIDGSGEVCIDFLDRSLGDYPDSFAMRRLLTSPEIYFDGRASGYINGPEMLTLMAA